jgi:hypothetical protein
MAFCAECWEPIATEPVACRLCKVPFHRKCLGLFEPVSADWQCPDDLCNRSRHDHKHCKINVRSLELLEGRHDASFRTDWDEIAPPGNAQNSMIRSCIDTGLFRYKQVPGRRGSRPMYIPMPPIGPCKWNPDRGRYEGDDDIEEAFKLTCQVPKFAGFDTMEAHLRFFSVLKYNIRLGELKSMLEWLSKKGNAGVDLKIYDMAPGVNYDKVVFVYRGSLVLRAALSCQGV